MKKHGFLIIFSIIVVILLLFLALLKVTKSSYEETTFKKISDIESGVVYIGKVSKEVKTVFKEVEKSYSLDCYNITNVDLDDLNDYLKENDLETLTKKSSYIFIYDGIPVWAQEKDDFLQTELNDNINKYLYGTLLENEKVYKVPSNGQELVNKIKSKNYTVLVIGKTDCNYCQLYLPVFNEVAKDHDLDIYYVDVDDFDSDEYKKITDLNLDIPAKCTTTGEATTTTGSFAKPMTLITKNGKTVDCILGYTSESSLTKMLTTYSIIK